MHYYSISSFFEYFFFSSRRRHTRCALVTGVQTCALPICHDPACVLCPLQRDCVALATGRVATLPTPKPGKPLPERSAHVLLLRDAHGRMLDRKSTRLNSSH